MLSHQEEIMQPSPLPILRIPQETIAFAYLYNLKPDTSILDVEFNGYKLLPINVFNERYKDHIYNISAINFPAIESVVNGLTCEYVLVATKLPTREGHFDNIDDIEPNMVCGAFINTVLYFRLFTSCDLQMGTFFISSNKHPERVYRNLFNTDLMSFFPKLQYMSFEYEKDQANLNLQQVTNIADFILKFDEKQLDIDSELLLALSAFNRACNTSDIFYKITGFVTTLESLLTSDSRGGEIAFKLKTRLVYLLNDTNISGIVRDAYELRSAIAHNGGFNKNFYRHFAKFKELKAVYDQIKLLEPLCQQSLLYFMNKFIEQDNFSVQNIISSLDKNIFEILATKNIAE